VVGSQGTILRAESGSLGSPVTVQTGASYDLLAITENDRYLVAVGEGGRLLRSFADNGDRWVESTTPFRFDIEALAFLDGLLLGVGQNESIGTSGSGFDWTLRDSTTPDAIREVATNGTVTVAVGDDGNVYRSTNDGETWSQPSVGITEDLRDVIHTPIGFLAVGTGGAIYSSPDGSSWTAATSVTSLFLTPFTGNLNAVGYNGTAYVAVGENKAILQSTDGLNWEQVGLGAVGINDVTNKGSLFIAVGDGGWVSTSSDGISWRAQIGTTAEDLYGVAASDSEILAVGANGTMLTSTTGSSWIPRISTVTVDLHAALYADESFHAFGEGFALLVSDEEGAWQSELAPTQNIIYGATLAGDQFVAVTDLGGIITSPTSGSTGLEEWTFRYTGEPGQDINEVAFGSQGFVAVGGGGQVFVSEDGRNWDAQTVQDASGEPIAEDLLGVAFGNGLYLAVGGQKLISSTDAVNWEVVTTWTVPVNSVSFGNGLFVVTGDVSTIFYSTNGTVWNGGSFNGVHAPAPLYDAVYDEASGVWVAVGDPSVFLLPGDEGEANMTQLFVSTDGQTWSRQEAPKINADDYFAQPMFTASAGDGVVRSFGTGRLIYYPDLDQWTVSALGDFRTNASLYTTGNGFGGFVYAGENGAIAGIDPGFLSFPGVTETLNGLAFGNQSYVAVGDAGRILYSEDARNWVLRTTENLAPLNDIAVDDLGNYVAVGGNETILRSADAISWLSASSVPDLPEGTAFRAVTTNESGFVAVGDSGAVLLLAQGDSWEAAERRTLENLNGVAAGGDTTVAVGDAGTILLNSGSASWSTVSAGGVTDNLYSVHYADGQYLAVGAGGTVLTSPDGSSWTAQTTGTLQDLIAVSYGELTAGGYWIAVGVEGEILVSVDDGVSWTTRASGTANSLRAIDFGQNNFLAAGQEGTALSSNNSSEWFSRPLGTDFALNGMTFFNGVFTLVGDFQTIVTSGRIEQRESQEILFLPIPDKIVSDPNFEPQVVATSGLPVTLEIVSGPATLAGNEIVLDGSTGTVVVRASQPGSVRYDAATPVDISFDVLLSTQTITFFGEPASAPPGSVSGKTFEGGSFTVTATSDSSLDPIIAVGSGPAIISAQSGGTATVTLTGAGSVTLTANQPGNGTFAPAAEAVRTFAAGKASQTITFDAPASVGEADPPLTLSATASSGLPVSFAVTSGPGVINGGNQLTLTGSGTVTIEATQAGDENYLAAPSVTVSILVEPAETGDVWTARTSGTGQDLFGTRFAGTRFYAVGEAQTILGSTGGQSWSLQTNAISSLRDIAFGGVPGIYVAVGDSGIPVFSENGAEWFALPDTSLTGLNGVIYEAGRFYAVGDGGVIWRSLNGESWSSLNSGVSTNLQDITYSNGILVAVGQNIIVTSDNGGNTWTVNTFAEDSLALNGVAGNGSGGLMIVGDAGQILFSANDGQTWSVRPSPISNSLNAVTYGNDRFVVVGGGGVIHTSGDNGQTWTQRQSGTTEILREVTYRADLFVAVGDNGTILSSGLSGVQTARTIDFPAISAPAGGLTTTLTATALAGGSPTNQIVEFNLVRGTGTITGVSLAGGVTTATLTISGDPGEYVVRASLPVEDDFLAVPGVDQSFTVVGEAQAVDNLFPSAGDLPFSSSPIGLSATSIDATTTDPTGLPVQFELVSGDASISGSSLTLNPGSIGGDVVIRAFNAGDSTYSPLDQTFTYSIVTEQTEIVFKAIPDKLLSDPNFFVEANTSDGREVGIQIIQGNGLISLRSFDQDDGNGNITRVHEVTIVGSDDAQGEVILEAFALPSTGVTADAVQRSFYISKFRQSINFSDPGAKTFGDPPFVLNASADGGGEISFSLADSTVASLDGSTVTILSAGTIKVTGTAEPNGDYGPATGELTVSVAKASQRLEFDEIDDQFEGSVISLPLVARTFIGTSETPASPTTYPITFTVVEGTDIATVSGSTLTLNGKPGTVKVQATQGGNVNVFAAAPVEQTFTISNFGRAPVSTTDEFVAAAYGGGQFVAASLGSEIARSVDASTDPSDWEAPIPVANASFFRDIAYGNGRFVIIGYNGKSYVSSSGGSSWSTHATSTTNVLTDIAYGAGLFVATESGVSGFVNTSSDGVNWTRRSVPTNSRIGDITTGKDASGRDRLIIVGSSGLVLTSSNGVSWQQQSLGTLRFSMESVAYGDGMFVAITTTGDYLYSEDGGVTWIQQSIPTAVLPDSPTLKAIAFGNSTFRVVGSSGTLLTATPQAIRQPINPADQSSRWVREISLGTNDLTDVTFGGDRFVAVGANGTILISLPEVSAVTLSGWIASFDFSGLTAGPVTGSDDPDGDSYPVSLEYALLGDPLNPEATPLTEVVNTAGEVKLSFRRRLVSDVTIQIQQSEDMTTWNTIRTYNPATGSWDNAAGLAESVDGNTVSVDFTVDATSPMTFLRVKVIE